MFLSTDPVQRFVGGQSIRFNPYIYAGANPTNYVDPNGEWFWFALAIGIPIITGVTAAAYDATTTQGVGLGGHNQGDLSAINLNQTAFAAVTGFLGGAEAVASTVLWPVYLAHGLINGLSPYEVNRNLLANIGLDDEYDTVHQSPYYTAGKTGGDVGILAASVTSLARSLNNLSFSTQRIGFDFSYRILNGFGLRAWANAGVTVTVPAVAGAGALILPGYTAIGRTISFFSSNGDDNDDLNLASRRSTRHILHGDRRGGGGHMHGAGKGKSEFPADWSETDIMNAVSDIATDPNVAWRVGEKGRRIAEEIRRNVTIRVVMSPDGQQVITAIPIKIHQ